MDYQNWTQALNQSIELLVQRTSGYLPNVLGAIALLVVGWILARVFRFACIRLISGLDGLLRRHGMERLFIRIGLERPVSELLGNILYWLIFLVFFTAATETLGLPVVATWLGGLSTYLPRILVAVLMLLGGLWWAASRATRLRPRPQRQVLAIACCWDASSTSPLSWSLWSPESIRLVSRAGFSP
jgi:hypothetical protein